MANNKFIGIITPYPTREQSSRMDEYVKLTKAHFNNLNNIYPIHLTELTLDEYSSGVKKYHRTEYTIDNSALIWIPKLDELVIYDDFGIDDFIRAAIEIAGEHYVRILYNRYN